MLHIYKRKPVVSEQCGYSVMMYDAPCLAVRSSEVDQRGNDEE